MFYGNGGVCAGLMGSVGIAGYGGTEISSDDMTCKGGTVGLVA